ncbi:MAG: erythromycin esterase family protein [Actinocatenispora sp.]
MGRGRNRSLFGVAALGLALVGLVTTGCSGVDTSRVRANAVVPLAQAPLDDAASARLVAVGEATHGNRDFVRARTLVIQNLVRRHGFRTVALEADFGGTAVADDYVTRGDGTARSAAGALGFDLYRTHETADLLQWLHDHDAGLPDREKVHVYGFDMQRYDANKQRLLRYLGTVDPARVEPTRTALAHLTDARRTSLDKATIAAGGRAAQRIVTAMRNRRDAYVSASSAESFALALHHADTIRLGAQLASSDDQRASNRDTWMARNVGWIADLAERRGHPKVVLGAHDGHVDKSGAAFGYESMGQGLAKRYGRDYFTIGTEFGSSTFIARDDGSGERKKFTVGHDAPVAALFGGERLGYVDFAQASARSGNRELLTSEVPMGMVGEGFRSIYSHLESTYTVTIVPARAYDALVYAPHAGPVTPL